MNTCAIFIVLLANSLAFDTARDILLIFGDARESSDTSNSMQFGRGVSESWCSATMTLSRIGEYSSPGVHTAEESGDGSVDAYEVPRDRAGLWMIRDLPERDTMMLRLTRLGFE